MHFYCFTTMNYKQTIALSVIDRVCVLIRATSIHASARLVHYRRFRQSWGVGLSPTFVCLSVYAHHIKKTDASRITKLDIEKFHEESWKPIYFGFKRSKVKVTSHKKHCRRGLLHSCECWLLLVAISTVNIDFNWIRT